MDNKKSDFDWKGKNFSFFSNTRCEFFPCHNLKNYSSENFNCLFCYCPLYEYADCGGNYRLLKNGCKDCSGCIIPHMKENYGMIVEKVIQKRFSKDTPQKK